AARGEDRLAQGTRRPRLSTHPALGCFFGGSQDGIASDGANTLCNLPHPQILWFNNDFKVWTHLDIVRGAFLRWQ
ncbi:MAG: hypothetical protein KGR98_03775, partial [Verrucomicrobia bacterium]|nr:hypothetical protein [Verrucomicrobiota bacterium]